MKFPACNHSSGIEKEITVPNPLGYSILECQALCKRFVLFARDGIGMREVNSYNTFKDAQAALIAWTVWKNAVEYAKRNRCQSEAARLIPPEYASSRVIAARARKLTHQVMAEIQGK